MASRIPRVLRYAVLGALSVALSGCYGWGGYRHHPYGWHGGPGYYGGPHPGPGAGGPGPSYNH